MPVSSPTRSQGIIQSLEDPKEKLEDKIPSLFNGWSTLASHGTSAQISFENPAILILYRDTLKLLLRIEWKKLPAMQRSKLLQLLTAETSNILTNNRPAQELFQQAIRLIQGPWDNPTLRKIIAGETKIADLEVLEFCLAEKAVLLSIRLDILCDSECEDIALELVAHCRRCLLLVEDQRLTDASTTEERDHWLDLHLALLYNDERREECIPIFNQLKLEDGVQLVQRLIDRGSAEKPPRRVWRNCRLVAELANQSLLTRALLFVPPPRDCLQALAVEFVHLERECMGASPEQVIDMLHKLVDNNSKITSSHMYYLCSALAEQFREDLKPFCIQLIIRALAIDLNDLEKKKYNSDEAAIKMAEAELAQHFSSLALLVKENASIYREVTLTAFSLQPTLERFNILTELAAQIAPNLTNQLRLLNDSSAVSKVDMTLKDVAGEISFVDEGDSGVELSDAGSPPLTENQEAAKKLGVSESVINDIAVVVHSQRWQVLCWKNGWEQLGPLCQRYVSERDSMRSVIKQLNFLKVDHSQFKDMPRPVEDEFWGIEKGYENCVYSDEESETVSTPLLPLATSKRKKRVRKQAVKMKENLTTSSKASSDQDSGCSKACNRRTVPASRSLLTETLSVRRSARISDKKKKSSANSCIVQDEEEESETVSTTDGPPAPPALKRKKLTKKSVLKSHLDMETDDDEIENLTLAELKKLMQEKRRATSTSIQTSTNSDCRSNKVATRSSLTETLSVRRSARISESKKKPDARGGIERKIFLDNPPTPPASAKQKKSTGNQILLKRLQEKRKKTVSIRTSSDLDWSCSKVATKLPTSGTISIRRSNRVRYASEKSGASHHWPLGC